MIVDIDSKLKIKEKERLIYAADKERVPTF